MQSHICTRLLGGLDKRLQRYTLWRNGDSGLCISPGPLEGPLLAKARRDLRHGAQKKSLVKLTFGLWSEEESGLHINCLEMLAVSQACQFFLPDIQGQHVLVHSDSRSVVSYINHQGGLVLKRLCTLTNYLFFFGTQRRWSHFFTPCPRPYFPCLLACLVSSIERLSLHGSPN